MRVDQQIDRVKPPRASGTAGERVVDGERQAGDRPPGHGQFRRRAERRRDRSNVRVTDDRRQIVENECALKTGPVDREDDRDHGRGDEGGSLQRLALSLIHI